MPHALILGRLRYTLEKLRTLPTAHYGADAKHLLRTKLSDTIKDIHALYPDGLSFEQRYKLLNNLDLLQHQFMAISPGGDVPAAMWSAVHLALTTSIETTLTDVVEAARRKSSTLDATKAGPNRPD